ncbi:hypothetical protein [Galactobacter caseinivorans]|uniref:DUF4352 domain-containing protein n=1 Tax=Galactobacter caseinivorans TaxID=2676123 RepID=A0A496PJP9_9MICC|nr:hypothetical protein [Galactobacter caseinivorans]RKW70734.1 hypothetical protein DWQ67_06425 [Galactobacter caseinivorans]
MKKSLSIAIAALLAVSVSGCANGGGESAGATSSAPSSRSGGSQSAGASTQATKAPVADPKLGETYTWEDGLKVTVSQPQQYKPSPSAENRVTAKARVFTITVNNGTEKGLIPGGIQISVTSGGAESSQVLDKGLWLDSSKKKIEPGETLTYKMAYEIKNPKDIKMSFSPGVQYDTKSFTS